jgi:hypothetical protein
LSNGYGTVLLTVFFFVLTFPILICVVLIFSFTQNDY